MQSQKTKSQPLMRTRQHGRFVRQYKGLPNHYLNKAIMWALASALYHQALIDLEVAA